MSDDPVDAGERSCRREPVAEPMRAGPLLLLAVMLVSAPLGLGQMAGEPVAETMPLTDQAPPGFSASSTLGCNSLAVHGLAEPGQGPQQQTKAYTSPSSAALGCPTLFRAPAPGAFNLTADATLELFVGCDQETAMHEPLDNVRVWLVRNGQAVSEGGGQLGTLCSPEEPLELEVTIPQPEDARFNESDMLGVNVTVFGSPNFVPDNVHVLVGGETSASVLQLPGLAEAFATEEEAEDDEEENETDAFENASELEGQTTSSGEDGVPGIGALGTILALIVLAVARTARRR